MLALAALVGVASQGTPLWTLVREGPADRLVILIEVAALGGIGLVTAMAAVLFAHRAFIARRASAPPLAATMIRALPGTSAALAVLTLLVIARTDLGRPPEAADRRGHRLEDSDRRALPLTITGWFGGLGRAGEGERDQEELREGTDPTDEQPILLIVVGAVVLVAAGGAAWWWSGRGSASSAEASDDGGPGSPRAEAVHEAVTDTIDAMLADPDPNTAIRGAYARLLEGLDASGSGRRDHEGPMEHLQRVLTMLRVRPGPLRQLTGLFEVARFSTRPLTSENREQALDALRAVAADLSDDVAFLQDSGTRQAGARR